MNPILSTDNVPFVIKDGKLFERVGLYRFTSLAAIGKTLRRYKTTKPVSINATKNVRVYYGPENNSRTHTSSYAYNVPVNVNGTTTLSIGCVQFKGVAAQTLRRAALRSSKVLA
jgi:hypothetical protein